MSPSKLVLCVIDAMAPAMLERAVAEGQAPILAALMERGRYVPDCVAAFPSVTPVCAASIATGVAQDRHLVPGMNWYSREENRYIEYGSSFRAAQRVGIARQLTDTVYNLNRAHLSASVPTFFEALDDAGVRTAGTTYLIYRGRYRHEPQRDTALTRLAAALLRHPVMGPRELFYADIFASRATGCRSTLGMPGVRDQHSGCVATYLLEHDLFDFLLLSLPDNDWHSHRHGPDAQAWSIGQADAQLARIVDAAGGLDDFLAEHAVIAMADHSQSAIAGAVSLQEELAELDVLGPGRQARGEQPRIAVCPSQRAAMVYALDDQQRDALRALAARHALGLDSVDLVMWLERDSHDAPSEGVICSRAGGELRFAPGGPVADPRGADWSLEGALGVIGAEVRDGRLLSPDYPDALSRVWSALTCPTSGEVLLSAAPGSEFADWGGQAHAGGGSHGSLHAADSLGRACDLRRRGARAGARPVGHPRRSEPGAGPFWTSAMRWWWHCSGAATVTLALVRGRRALIVVVLALAAWPASAGAARVGKRATTLGTLSVAGSPRLATAPSASAAATPEAPIPVAPSNQPPAGRRLSANRVIVIASALPKMRAVRAKYRGSYGGAYLKGALRWQVSFFSANGRKEIGQVIIADASGRVLEQWTGFQVAWTMARGYPGAFGRHVNSLYVWLPCACSSCCRSSTFAGPSRCFTSTCSCCSRSRSRSPSSTTGTSTRPSRSSTPRCCTCSRGCSRCWHRRGVGAARLAARARPARGAPGCGCSCPRRGWRSGSSF